MKGLRYFFMLIVVLSSFSLVFTGCGDGGGDGEGGGEDEGGIIIEDTELSKASFNISGAVQLLAQQDTVLQATSALQSARSIGERPLFTYKIVNQGLTKGEVQAAKSMSPEVRAVFAAESSTSGTNLLAIDADGNASLAIESDYLIKVMYTVVDPAGEYVYIALDTGWWNWDGNDYSRYIAQENCAFFKVSLTTDEGSCVKEGLFVQNMDDDYMKAISSDQKPIQFDDDGNLYFTATGFIRHEESWEECWWDEGAQSEICTTHFEYWIDSTSWNPRLYRVDKETGNVSDLTPDNTEVAFFLVLSSGEIVYQSRNIEDWGSAGLYMWQNGATINLSNQTWGVNFFTGDSSNSVMWGSWEEYGLRFARPVSGGGMIRATLDTRLFGSTFDDRSSSPRRVILGDDGRLYGVFESWQCNDYDSSTGIWTCFTVLSVYQILPYDGIPKVELTIPEQQDWWHWMENTPFQISRGYLYYTESENVIYNGISYGNRDVIEMIKLSDRAGNTLLDSVVDGVPQRYEIYSWRLSGNKLYFSALDLTTTTVVTGEVDTLLVRQGASESEYLTVTETASALGATSAIQDIEILTPQESEQDSGSAPVVEQFHVKQDNIYSASIDFTKYMNKNSVESNLTFDDDSSNPATTFKVWIYKSLHLIPDLSTNGLADDTTDPLAASTTYMIALGGGTQDAYGWDLIAGTQGTSVSFTTRPDSGWYYSTTDDDGTLSSGGVAKYAGPATDWTKETFRLYADAANTTEVDASGNVRIEFSAKNYGWDGIDIVLWNKTHYETDYPDDTWLGIDAIIRMGNWTSVDYKTSITDDWANKWSDGNTPEMFNGSWARYRIDFYGTNLVISYSQDGTTFTEARSITDFRDRDGNTDSLTFLLRAVNPVVVDNLQVTALDSDGNASSAGDILDITFTGSIDSEFGTTDVGADYGDLANWW